MLNSVKKFLHKKWHILLGGAFGAMWGITAYWMLVGKYTLWTWFVAQGGWAAALMLVTLMSVQIIRAQVSELKVKKEIMTYYNGLLSDAMDSLEMANGYREDLDNNVAIYSKMTSGGVSTPCANSVVSFAQELSSDDSVFLIRLSHSKSNWVMRISGRPIYVTQAQHLFKMAHEKLEDVAKESGSVVIKKRGVVN